MDADLTEIALNALEAAEAEDEKNSTDADTGDSVDNKNADGGGDKTEDTSDDKNGDTKNEDSEDVEKEDGEGEKDEDNDNESGEDSDDSDNSDDSSDNSNDNDDDKKEVKKEDKKELSDDEFEEMAKKRGYAKQPSEDEKKKEEERKQQEEAEKAQIEQLAKKPQEIPQEVWDETPLNNRITYNQLPIITARGENGQSVNVKLPNQLPKDFKFADEKARVEFQTAMGEQTNRMNQILNALNARDQRRQEESYRQAEAQKVVNEVSALQKSGALPTPKAKYGDAAFDNDPAVKTINNVLQYRIERMREGANISVRDAVVLYKAEHPDEFKAEQKAKGDSERKQIAKKIAGNKKTTGKTTSDGAKHAPKIYKPGMSTQDVLDRALDILD